MTRHRLLAFASDLSVRFPGGPPVVDGVALEVRAGECVALVGESGSGKSLTARALLGLLPRTAVMTSDSLQVLSPAGDARRAPASGAREWAAIRGLHGSLVPQDALGSLDPLRRVEHEVGDTLRLHRLASGRARRERVIRALTSVGMPEPARRMRQRSDELSGGLRQRALVASALIADPSFIIADEPTTALDSDRRDRLLAELRRRVDEGSGVLLITHDLVSVMDIADRVLIMRDGRIIEQGPPERVLSEPEHAFTRELLDANPAGVPRGTRLLGNHEAASAPVRAQPPTAGALLVEPRLELDDISVSFGAHNVLNGASLTVNPNETVGLIGESGSGKTTLLRVALGLLSPEAGSVAIDGIDRAAADRRTRRSLRRRIAFVPQDPLDSFPRGATGARILADALRAAGAPRTERARSSLSLAAEVGLDPAMLARPASTLSGGQRQRLAIARALARNPELILLDEPVSALDVTVQARVLDLLDDLQAQRGTSYLLVSHDRAVIEHMSDRVVQLRGGRLSRD